MFSEILERSSKENVSAHGSEIKDLFLSYIHSKPSKKKAYLLKKEELVKIFNNANSNDAIEGEKIISSYMNRYHPGQARYATKESILYDAMVDWKSNFSLIESQIKIAWPLSNSIHSQRIFLLHLAFEKCCSIKINQKTYDTKSGFNKSVLTFNIRTECSKTEVLVELNGLLPPLFDKLFLLLEDFLAINGIAMISLNFLWIQSTAAIEWNTIGMEDNCKTEMDSVMITYEQLIAKGLLYRIDVAQVNQYFLSTVLQFYTFIEFGKSYQKSIGEFREVKQYQQAISNVYLKTCACSEELCKGSYEFHYHSPCSNKV